jgi:hypothetical protein
MSRKTHPSLKTLQTEFTRQQEILAKAEVSWRERWDFISSPFLKVQDMNSPAFRAEREAVLGPWREARAALDKARQRAI